MAPILPLNQGNTITRYYYMQPWYGYMHPASYLHAATNEHTYA